MSDFQEKTMNNPLILTLDFGTQSLRAALVNKQGEIEAIEKKKYDPVFVSPEKGYAEQDPDFYYEYAVELLTSLAEKNKDELDRIIGATLTTFRDSSVYLDENFKSVRPMILWTDQRTAEAKEPLPFVHKLLFALVGMTDTIELNRKRTMAHWLKENEPENWKRVKKYVNISGYLVYKLTGNLSDSVASVTGHFPINFRKRKWQKEGALKGRIFGIPSEMLCELKQPGEVLGIISDELADKCGLPKGIKLYASGSDKGCETIGLGALDKNLGAVSYGTACTIEVSNQKYHEPEKFLPAYPAAVPDWYNMEVQIYRGYWMLTWFSREFASELMDEAKIENIAVEEVLNRGLKSIPPGSDGLILQPFWGPALSRPLAKGLIIGFTDIHTRNHLYRAIIEGIAYGLLDGLQSIEKSQRHKVQELRISGGGSQNDSICQITADIFGLPVKRVQTYETTTLGASMATFVAAGEFKNIDEAIDKMTHIRDVFYPDPVAHQKYEYLYKNVYLNLYPSLKKIHKKVDYFNKKKNK